MSLSILFVTAMYPHAERPGSGAFVMHQAEQLRALGHRVDVVLIRGYRSRWNYLKGAIEVLRATWRGNYEVVHVHYGLTGISALLRWRTPLVVTLHGSDVQQGRIQPLVSRLIAKLAEATIVVSPDLAARCPGTIIPCGVDLARFRPSDRRSARETLGLLQDRKYILFPFDPKRRLKRFDLAEAAVELLRQDGCEVSLLPVFDAPNEAMPTYYSAADAMILCSDTEGSPTSVKEALACNLPVVATDVGDVRFLLEGIEGAQLCQQTAVSLASGLRRVLSRQDWSAFRGRQAMEKFDQAMTAKKLVEVYRSVAPKARPYSARLGTS